MGAAPQPHDRPTRAGQKAQAAVGTILPPRGWGRAASDSAACRAEGRRGVITAPPAQLRPAGSKCEHARRLPPQVAVLWQLRLLLGEPVWKSESTVLKINCVDKQTQRSMVITALCFMQIHPNTTKLWSKHFFTKGKVANGDRGHQGAAHKRSVCADGADRNNTAQEGSNAGCELGMLTRGSWRICSSQSKWDLYLSFGTDVKTCPFPFFFLSFQFDTTENWCWNFSNHQ